MQQLFRTGETFTSLATEIQDLMNVDVIIANEDGMIIACTRNERLNQFHEGAYLSFKNEQEMVITKDLTEQLIGVKEGVMIPLLAEQVPVGVLGLTGDPEVVTQYAPFARKLSELYLMNAIAQISLQQKTEILELFVHDWLLGNLTNQQLLERSKFLQVDLKKYGQAISIKFPLKTDGFSLQDLEELKHEWDGNKDTLIVRWGQGKIIMLGEGLEKDILKHKLTTFIEKLTEKYDQNIFAGVGQALDYSELITSFNQAEHASFIAEQEGKIIFEEELRFKIIQYGLENNMIETFLERTIAPILTEKTLLETLDCWLENNMSIQKTSEALSIHKNTLYYRLDKISTLTELDVQNLHNIVLLYMSNRFLNKSYRR